MARVKKPHPTEAQEQMALFEWAAVMRGRYSELDLLFHITNEGTKSAARGAQLKRLGLKAGVPDLLLPVARGGYHGLFIEMKSEVGRPSAEQLIWIEHLRQQGYVAIIAHGWSEAATALEAYLNGNTKRSP